MFVRVAASVVVAYVHTYFILRVLIKNIKAKLKKWKYKQVQYSAAMWAHRNVSWLVTMLYNGGIYIIATKEQEGLSEILAKIGAIWILLKEQTRPCVFRRYFKLWIARWDAEEDGRFE